MMIGELKNALHREHEASGLWSTAGTLYQVLMDRERTSKLSMAIASTVRAGHVVADLGTGSGVLACFAVMAGARAVYAIESDPSNYKAAATVIRDNHMQDAIMLIQGDAAKVELPEKVDVVICELMSTALLDEPQIQLMNHALNRLLKKDGVTIPRRATTFAEYVEAECNHYGLKLRVPQYEWTWIPLESRELSEPTTLFDVDFRQENREHIRCTGSMKIIRTGILNGIRLSTRTYLTEDVIHDSSMGFCPRVVIPTKHEFLVHVGQSVDYELSYRAGHGFSSVEVDVYPTESR